MNLSATLVSVGAAILVLVALFWPNISNKIKRKKQLSKVEHEYRD